MSEQTSDILVRSSEFVKRLLKEHLPPKLCYHNLDHTEYVVKSARKIGIESGLDEHDLDCVSLAAWFHDTGFTQCYQGHESVSERIAYNFLTKEAIDNSTLNKILNCIRATKMPQTPGDLLEKVICDADMFHLSDKDYWSKSELLRLELMNYCKKPIEKYDWYKQNIAFLMKHHYFTDFGVSQLEKQKAKNLLRSDQYDYPRGMINQ
ncbi:HD domain-containing protein [Fulvivirgaceae bacterium BMA10]|uniref:HD domain-containing protein n=1 Tax=Splendidivirga corallicola TaxID=3051826 RepID=A0ABT8KXI7_9BACT|nr:HD domain-containing protein [Fulvivirgaceae bacterium BMA10]